MSDNIPTKNINIVASVDSGTAGSTVVNTTSVAVADQTDTSGSGDVLQAPIYIDNETDIVLTKTVEHP